MTHGHAHEEAEHASHHAADPFDKRVALTMVVIAALLAGVKVLGHRTHNEVLAYQIKAGVTNTEAANRWNFFQAKKMREVLARFEATLLMQEARRGRGDQEASPVDLVRWTAVRVATFGKAGKEPPIDWNKRLEALAENLEEVISPPKSEVKDKGARPDAHTDAAAIIEKQMRRHADLRSDGLTSEQATRVVKAEESAARYNQESRYILEQARGLDAKSLEYQEKSEHKHHQAFFFDMGELGVELGLVLCSVAILSKRPGYWFAGMGVSLLGVVAVLIGFVA
jgi:hypothetical protein